MWKYEKEHVDYVRSIAKGRYNDEITKMFNEKFTFNKSIKAISSMKKNYGITSGKLPKRRRTKMFTDKQEEFLKENVKGLRNEELTKLLNDKFNLNFDVSQIKSWKARNKISSGLTGQFVKGRKSWNKGMKGLQIGGKDTQFKKGEVPINHRPVGSERICSKDGYTFVKIKEPNIWEAKHRVIWEKAHGKIPKNHVVLFGDGDKQNFDLDNLILVSRAQLAMLNKYDLIQNDVELTKTGIIIADVAQKMSDRKKKVKT